MEPVKGIINGHGGRGNRALFVLTLRPLIVIHRKSSVETDGAIQDKSTDNRRQRGRRIAATLPAEANFPISLSLVSSVLSLNCLDI